MMQNEACVHVCEYVSMMKMHADASDDDDDDDDTYETGIYAEVCDWNQVPGGAKVEFEA
jgi:hypothetical protein